MATDRPRREESDAELAHDADLGDERVRNDDVARDFGTTEPPDPLGQAEPWVTEAHLAERGPSGRAADLDETDLDEVDGDPDAESGLGEAAAAAPARRRRPSRAEREARAARQEAAGRAGNEAQVAARAADGAGDGGNGGEPPTELEHHHANEPAHPRKGLFGRTADFMRASFAELRRVQWPDRRQVGQGTAVTLGFVVVAGAYLGLLDAIWNPIVQAIL
jgi:preprotein translocase SecE subunit